MLAMNVGHGQWPAPPVGQQSRGPPGRRCRARLRRRPRPVRVCRGGHDRKYGGRRSVNMCPVPGHGELAGGQNRGHGGQSPSRSAGPTRRPHRRGPGGDGLLHRQPDPDDVAQQVVFGTSGHRGSSLDGAFNEAHILATTQAIAEYRAAQGTTGPLFIGRDTHALSEPAWASALEVLAANDVAVMIDSADRYTPTPAVSHAILTLQPGPGRRAGRRDRRHPVAQPAARRRDSSTTRPTAGPPTPTRPVRSPSGPTRFCATGSRR